MHGRIWLKPGGSKIATARAAPASASRHHRSGDGINRKRTAPVRKLPPQDVDATDLGVAPLVAEVKTARRLKIICDLPMSASSPPAQRFLTGYHVHRGSAPRSQSGLASVHAHQLTEQ